MIQDVPVDASVYQHIERTGRKEDQHVNGLIQLSNELLRLRGDIKLKIIGRIHWLRSRHRDDIYGHHDALIELKMNLEYEWSEINLSLYIRGLLGKKY